MLPKTYEPKPIEEKFIRQWQGRRLFVSTVPQDKSKKSFVIVIPPPNITGALHMGHALNNVLQDILIRYNRMCGHEAYWVPGTDHGGIATQTVIEKKLAKERKLRRHDLGREKFVAELWKWYGECGSTILTQLKSLGCALDTDPSNVRFTMDEKRARAVNEEFRLLWQKGRIYRGERMINWCVRCGTALSDIEVEHETASSKLWHIHYPLENGGEGLTVATTRPETMLGDTAVAVHPEDSRYKNLVGKKLQLPLTGRLIPVIADEAVDSAFGTGAVKVTPAHDPADNEIGKRHNLETLTVIGFDGKMQNVPPQYSGMDRSACRQQLVKDLDEGGFLKKEEPYQNAVSACSRCNQPIEPLVSEQWFVKMKDLAAPAIRAAENGSVKFHPENWKKPYLEWLGRIEDWCISRQIWWGHRIPVWYCETCSAGGLVRSAEGEVTRVSFKDGAKPILSAARPEKCPQCGGHGLVQDPDVLDTWFSSGLWPFSVFGWPEETPELNYYYPTSVLVTGYEIIYLWVARMVMLGMEFRGKVPFSDVLINGIVRDKHGKKMSKSLGNVIDPLDMTAKYGTDAVRFALASQALPGRDIPFAEESNVGPRNFCNKIYNACRFVLMNLPEGAKIPAPPQKPENLADRWILHRYNAALRQAKHSMAAYDPASAALALYRFFWDDYCDWYVELAKPRLAADDAADRETVLAILVHIMEGALKALHPFMPFITEELAAALRPHTGGKAEFLISEQFPQPDKSRFDEAAAKEMELVMGVTTALRTIRSLYNIHPAKEIAVRVNPRGEESRKLLQNAASSYICRLAKASALETAQSAPPSGWVTTVFGDVEIWLDGHGVIDFAAEKLRLQGELEKLEKEMAHCSAQLANENFKTRAPKEKVDEVCARLEQASSKKESIKDAISRLPNG
ncbi:MAG: valine--tRNA ligase [Elusimicrobiales bacterium]